MLINFQRLLSTVINFSSTFTWTVFRQQLPTLLTLANSVHFSLTPFNTCQTTSRPVKPAHLSPTLVSNSPTLVKCRQYSLTFNNSYHSTAINFGNFRLNHLPSIVPNSRHDQLPSNLVNSPQYSPTLVSTRDLSSGLANSLGISQSLVDFFKLFKSVLWICFNSHKFFRQRSLTVGKFRLLSSVLVNSKGVLLSLIRWAFHSLSLHIYKMLPPIHIRFTW